MICKTCGKSMDSEDEYHVHFALSQKVVQLKPPDLQPIDKSNPLIKHITTIPPSQIAKLAKAASRSKRKKKK